MRILKFAGVFIGTLLLVFLAVFGFRLDALFILLENQKGMQEGQEWVAKTYSLKGLTEYIGVQPEYVSIVSIAVNNPDSSVLYNEHAPRTMGRLSNIFLVIEYSRLIDRGELDPDSPVSLDKVNRYQLPYVDASNHADALSALADAGKISENGTITLSDLVHMAVAFNDMAASDYLFFAIGQKKIEQLMDKLSIEETESLLPLSGLYITLNPHVYDTSLGQRIDSLSRLSRTAFEKLVLKTSQQFTGNETFRKKVINRFEENKGLGIKFTKERDALDFFPKTTALEMAGLMKRILQEELISGSVSRRVKKILSWPLTSEQLDENFQTYGAMYDSRMGLVNGIDFGASSYSGEPFAQAVFFDRLPVAFWFHMSSNLMHQDFQQRLIWDPALREATVEELTKRKAQNSNHK